MARAPEILGTHYVIPFPGRQLKTARNLRKLPLHARYDAGGAAFGQFYGWERPLYFGAEGEPTLTFNRPDWHEAVGAEVRAAHEAAAIFDASPFGKIEVTNQGKVNIAPKKGANLMLAAGGSDSEWEGFHGSDLGGHCSIWTDW